MIQNAKEVEYATAWINTCIIIHAFCMDNKVNFCHSDWLERGRQAEQELQSSADNHQALQAYQEEETFLQRDITLSKGKAKREELKKLLFESEHIIN